MACFSSDSGNISQSITLATATFKGTLTESAFSKVRLGNGVSSSFEVATKMTSYLVYLYDGGHPCMRNRIIFGVRADFEMDINTLKLHCSLPDAANPSFNLTLVLPNLLVRSSALVSIRR